MKLNQCLCYVLATTFVMGQAKAMPQRSADMTELVKKVDLSGVGNVIRDHKQKHTLYVMPGDMKFTGKFAQTNGGIDCRELHRMRVNTFKMPTHEEFQTVIERNRYYSPAFENAIGVYAKNSNVLRKLIEAKSDVSQYLQEHKIIYGAYTSAKADLELSTNDSQDIKEEIAEKKDSFVTQLAILTSEEERSLLREQFKKELKALNARKAIADREVRQKRSTYRRALKDWAPYKDQLDWLSNVENNLQSSFDKLRELARESYRDSVEMMNQLESKVIGYASVGYSLVPTDRVELLNQRIRKAGLSYQAVPLDIFNVKMNPGVTKIPESGVDPRSGHKYQLETYYAPASTLFTLGTKKSFLKLDATLEQDGQEPQDIGFQVMDIDESIGGSQAFETPITLGALCGYPNVKEVSYDYSDSRGRQYSQTASQISYSAPNTNKNVFVQNIAVRYNFYEKAEAIEGRCEMNVKKASSYTRNRGRKTSWRWFKKVSHSWDDTRQSFNNNMGISCTLKSRPQGANPEESKLMNLAFEKALYKDIFSMFVMTYAKDYKITPLTPDLLSADSKFFTTLGNGVMNLCGTNVYCQVGGIVLKSLDELVGSRTTGTTSNTTTISGKYVREMKRDSYLVSEGYANVELKVCLDHTQCVD